LETKFIINCQSLVAPSFEQTSRRTARWLLRHVVLPDNYTLYTQEIPH